MVLSSVSLYFLLDCPNQQLYTYRHRRCRRKYTTYDIAATSRLINKLEENEERERERKSGKENGNREIAKELERNETEAVFKSELNQ